MQLRGRWRGVPAASRSSARGAAGVHGIDATAVDRLDSVGVMQLLRFANRNELDTAHSASTRTTTPWSKPSRMSPRSAEEKREYGFAAALGRLGFAVQDNWKEVIALVSFFGENLVKLMRMVKEPQRLRLTATVHHMEQVGLDAVPLVALLSYLVGAVIAFLGATILADFGATIFVVELVSIAFLREFAVLLTAILLPAHRQRVHCADRRHGRREEVDAIRTLGLDPVDLLVIPRVLAML